MSLSLVCSCGVRLEIDDKFAGQTIRCPDCHREFKTKADKPRAQWTSGWAIASLILALVGTVTLIGPVLAIACGVISLRQQARFPERVGGRGYAQAGIALGVFFTLLSLVAYRSPYVLDIDGLFRELQWANQLDYPADLRVVKESEFSLTRANSSWGIFRHRGQNATAETDDQILIKPRDDAQVACMTRSELQDRLEPEDLLEKAFERFRTSEVVALVHQKKDPPNLTMNMTRGDKKPIADPKSILPKGALVQEMLVDVPLRGRPRTFLIRVIKLEGTSRIHIIAAGTRQHLFASLEAELRQIINSYTVER